MGKVLMCTAVFGLLLGRAAAQERPAKKTKGDVWSVRHLEIVKRAPTSDIHFVGEGTSLELQLRLERKIIVGIDRAAFKLISFVDDKGTNLLTKPSDRNSVGTVQIQDAGKAALVSFRADGRPAPGASKIRIKGTVTALVAKDEKQIETMKYPLGFAVDSEIGRLRLPEFGARKNALELTGTRPLKKAVLEIYGDGKMERRGVVECNVQTSHVKKTDGKDEFSSYISWSFQDKVTLPQGVFRLTYYDTVERMDLPLDVEVGLGFLAPAKP